MRDVKRKMAEPLIFKWEPFIRQPKINKQKKKTQGLEKS